MAITEKLYKSDTKGKTRVWWLEYTDEAYRTHAGILDGKIVTSGWKYPEQKNVGKANETSIEQQVLNEVTALVEKQTNQGKYHRELEDTALGAKFLEPMLAHKYDPKKTAVPAAGFVSQPKLDGIRCLVKRDGTMQSRAGKPLLSAPHVALQLKEWFETHPNVVALDGELYNHDLKHDFERIISLARKAKPTGDDLAKSAEEIQFHVYDVITDSKLPYFGTQDGVTRATVIANLKDKFFSVKVVPSKLVTTKDEIDEMLSIYVEQGYEGQMLRDRNAAYEHKRSKSLLKHKEFEDEECEIVEVLEGVGNWNGLAKAVIVKRADGTIQQSGMRGTFAFANRIFNMRKQLVGTQVTVRYQGNTNDGKMRFPVVTVFWEGMRDV